MYIKAWRVSSTAMNSCVIISTFSIHPTSYLFSNPLKHDGRKAHCDNINCIPPEHCDFKAKESFKREINKYKYNLETTGYTVGFTELNAGASLQSSPKKK